MNRAGETRSRNESMGRAAGSLLVVRGGGDLASGVIHRLYRCGYRVLILECAHPSAIRREVAFCEAVYDGEAFVEGVLSHRIERADQCEAVWAAGEIPLLVDGTGEAIRELHPAAMIDAILAKRNLGTSRDMAPLTIALGPGFTAGEDVDYVVETQRGHDLGRIIEEGEATPNTGIPGVIAGYGKERVIHSPAAGILRARAVIGDLVEKGQVIAVVEMEDSCSDAAQAVPVYASLTGVLRGIIRDGYRVPQGMKIADIDPRKEQKKKCSTISDKARCIAGSVVEILMAEGILP